MTPPWKRRDFLKSLSALAALEPARFTLALGEPTIQTRHFAAMFDRSLGVLAIRRADGTPFLSGSAACVNLASPDSAGHPGTRRRSSASKRYRHELRTDTVRDGLGSGKRLTVVSADRDREVDLTLQLVLYDELPAAAIELTCRNASSRDLLVHSLEPLRVVAGEAGGLYVPGVSHCLTDGIMYYDGGQLHHFGSPEGGITSGVIKDVTLANGPIAGSAETIQSWWNATLTSGEAGPGVALGYLENSSALGNLLLARPAEGQLAVVAESVSAPPVVLRPGATRSSNRLMITTAETGFAALERYTGAAGRVAKARSGSIINGWCSWFYTLGQVSEAEVVANTVFAAEHLKPHGLEYIQIDEGFQRWHGEWEGNERFPHGMKWLADTIRSHGLKAGLWISPYVISEPTELFRRHPDWLVHNPDGSLQRIGNWEAGAEPPADENPKRYCLDVTNPGAAQWLHDLVSTIVHDWGYEMIKLDFMAWSILAARRFHDPSVSTAQAYRRGMEIIRAAAGEACHINECGPGNITVGLIDSMRIESDANYGFNDKAWETYFINPTSSMAAAAHRYAFHRRTWVNDVDHLCMNLLDNQQAEAAATIIGLSGGNLISGDRLTQLDPYKLEILKKVTPSSGLAAVPVDLFESESPSVFRLRVDRPFGSWTVVGCFNPSLTDHLERKIPLDRLGLVSGKAHLVFDFWRQQLVSEVVDELKVTVQPGSVTLLALQEKGNRPAIIGTDRHVLMGAVELEDVSWDESTRTLSGTSLGPLGSSHKISIYVPGEHPWTWGGYVLYRDYDGFSAKLMQENVVQLQVRFEKGERVKWVWNSAQFFE